MDGRTFDKATVSRRKKALVHLASIDPIELCNEAKLERCRATRDLRSCGRHVQRVLVACGHAALCEECGQRCDVCPICRIPLAKGEKKPPLRLYNECIEAGLISKRYDDRLQSKDDGENQLIADVQRLDALFDAALENNLVSVICHYVTDVCMDESAVSSDPVIAFLLDEKVVKDWCRRTFEAILKELQAIYNIAVKEMKGKLTLLLHISSKLAGISNVLEVLESSFRDSLSATVQDLNHLQESILKTKQHLDVICWCIRHQFLENTKSQYFDFASWRASFNERKSEAINRAWPDPVTETTELTAKSTSSLFIEDALSNLDNDQGRRDSYQGELDIVPLLSDQRNSYFQSRINGMAGSYPFKSLRAAADLLFLQGNSDLVLAKEAIFLYYLFDRHWTLPVEEWKHIVDDFAAIFNITRHSLLESFVFYLLDDHSDEALKEAIHFLPEISGPSTHPKVARILLERQNPDAALMVLRWSGRDGGAKLVSLQEAVTAVRVRVESGLLTEAFMYQKMMVTKVKDKKPMGDHDEVLGQHSDWLEWVEILVTEICCLCIRRNLVDRMIELPWSASEEKHLHKCLFDYAVDDPSSTVGSLLVVFYLQRYRYAEAYQLDRKLQTREDDFISNDLDEETAYKVRSMSHWRRGLVDQSVELLPEILQQQLKSGKLPEASIVSTNNNESIPAKPDLPKVQAPILGSLFFNFPQNGQSNGFGYAHH